MLPIQRDLPVAEATPTPKGVTIRALPLDVPTRVTDNGSDWYREVWRAGAFDKLQPSKTVLQRDHVDAHGSNIVAVCRAISEDGGFVVTDFEFIDGAPLAPLARALLQEGTWDSVSVSVIMTKDGSRQAGDLVERTRVGQFRHLAIVERPAYDTAKVMAVRGNPSEYLAKLEHARMLAVKRPRH